jgi:hypothetical protein
MAQWEIQIEGTNGWADNLPTKKFKKNGQIIWTHYHSYFALFTFFVFHYIFLFVDWNLNYELKILSDYCKFFIIEDILWFVCNTEWKISKKKDWWREPKLFHFIPLFYFPVLSISYFLYQDQWIQKFLYDLIYIKSLDILMNLSKFHTIDE